MTERSTESQSAGGALRVSDLKIERGVFHAGPFTFEAAPGGVTTLVGPNGCGKSTLLETVAGLLPTPSGTIARGEVTWSAGGRAGLPPHERAIGYLPQRLGLWPHLTVRAQALLVGGEEARVQSLAESLDLSGLLDRTPAQLSGGEAQRAALLRALAPAPTVLLLDEPTGQQFPAMAKEVRAVVDAEVARGVIALVATHHAWPGSRPLELFAPQS